MTLSFIKQRKRKGSVLFSPHLRATTEISHLGHSIVFCLYVCALKAQSSILDLLLLCSVLYIIGTKKIVVQDGLCSIVS